jgi:outer membrane protein assembly factor BamA
LSQHWQLLGNDGFTYSANPFDSYLSTPGIPTMNNPNPVSYYPLTQFTQNLGLLTLTDQLSKVDTLTFTGSENLRRTSTYNLLTAVPFYNLISYGGRAAFSHQFSARLSLGAGYDYNSLDFGHGQQRSGIQTISMTVDYLIRPNMSISGWVGPEHTGTKTVVGIPVQGQIFYFITHDTLWSTSAGANFSWRGRRDSVQAGFSRQVSDGGGIIATSQVNVINGSYRRSLTQKMDLTVGARYLHDVSTSVASRSYNNTGLNAGLNYKLAKSLNATAQYSYLHQTQSNTILLGSGNYNSNIVGVTINYTWDHPLGR